MFRMVKKMQNSGLEIVAGLTLPLILVATISHVFTNIFQTTNNIAVKFTEVYEKNERLLLIPKSKKKV